MSGGELGRWQARRARRAGAADLVGVVVIALLAALTVVCGRRARMEIAPRSAGTIGGMLDELQLPNRLLDTPLADSSGATASLLTRIHQRRAVIAFYAPWCGPCQRELPELAELVAGKAQLIVVISADESVEETHRKLTNLGLNDVGFVIDIDNRLAHQARVTALPTTFLVTQHGRILVRASGYSFSGLYRMRRMVEQHAPSVELVDGGAP